MVNHHYLFMKNFPQDISHRLAHCISLLGYPILQVWNLSLGRFLERYVDFTQYCSEVTHSFDKVWPHESSTYWIHSLCDVQRTCLVLGFGSFGQKKLIKIGARLVVTTKLLPT